MCLNCGCLLPSQDHGDPANLTLADLATAADAGGTTVEAAAWNIPRTLTVASTPAWPPTLGALTTRPVLIWDVDGILSFTAEALCSALNARFGTHYDPVAQRFFAGRVLSTMLPADQAAWLLGEIGTGFDLLGSCAPDWHAADTMMAAMEAGYSSQIVTERHPLLAGETQAWLSGWGIKAPPVVAVGLGNKPKYLTTRYGPGKPALLIDDNPMTRTTIAREGLDVWLPSRPYVPDVVQDHVRVFPAWETARYWLGLSQAP